ncbi:hypothetical protein F5B20DRAFT_221085 [Whalleya microplaca]|nr:hypothetical protein F5B20DRAFT_221085 [Whalleya microplaca]
MMMVRMPFPIPAVMLKLSTSRPPERVHGGTVPHPKGYRLPHRRPCPRLDIDPFHVDLPIWLPLALPLSPIPIPIPLSDAARRLHPRPLSCARRFIHPFTLLIPIVPPILIHKHIHARDRDPVHTGVHVRLRVRDRVLRVRVPRALAAGHLVDRAGDRPRRRQVVRPETPTPRAFVNDLRAVGDRDIRAAVPTARPHRGPRAPGLVPGRRRQGPGWRRRSRVWGGDRAAAAVVRVLAAAVGDPGVEEDRAPLRARPDLVPEADGAAVEFAVPHVERAADERLLLFCRWTAGGGGGGGKREKGGRG